MTGLVRQKTENVETSGRHQGGLVCWSAPPLPHPDGIFKFSCPRVGPLFASGEAHPMRRRLFQAGGLGEDLDQVCQVERRGPLALRLMCLCLSVCLPLCRPLFVSDCVCVCVCLCFPRNVCLSACLSVTASVSVGRPVCLCLSVSVYYTCLWYSFGTARREARAVQTNKPDHLGGGHWFQRSCLV